MDFHEGVSRTLVAVTQSTSRTPGFLRVLLSMGAVDAAAIQYFKKTDFATFIFFVEI